MRIRLGIVLTVGVLWPAACLAQASGMDLDTGRDAVGFAKTAESWELAVPACWPAGVCPGRRPAKGAGSRDLGTRRSGLLAGRCLSGPSPGIESPELFFNGWVRLRGIAEPEDDVQWTEDGGRKTEAGNGDACSHPGDRPPTFVGASAQGSRRGETGPKSAELGAIKSTETKGALRKLRERGLKACVLLRWDRKSSGPGPGSGAPSAGDKTAYLPGDLREAFARGRWLGATYGDLVDAWEVDNEPDLGFVPEAAENYAAYLKAMYLGIKAGSQRTEDGERRTGESPATGGSKLKAAPLVLMGALGLPPGPWLERFAANDGFAYTDGFNYHYYGYAEDFTGVYRQHETALRELGARSMEPGADSSKLIAKSYPIFLTEVGYGMLGKAARDTKAGRLRQWRWFKSVGRQAADLKIEAPMAFLLPPYLEYDNLEFGLTVAAAQKTEDGGRKTGSFSAGGITYAAEDFGAKSPEPWMKLIGREIGGNEITPALAQWLAERHTEDGGQETANLRPWPVSTPTPSPVVMDFAAGEGLSFVKRYNGSFVTGLTPGERLEAKGEGQLPPEPKAEGAQPKAVRAEEFMVHVRTANGNLYEVYPTRQATAEWQHYLEPRENFTMSFYGRAGPPWRFRDNRPVSLVVVMYPKQLPAVYEFRRVQLVRIGQTLNTEVAESTEKAMRYGHGKAVLYNFSGKPVSGRLILPKEVTTEHTENTELIELTPGERREIPVTIKVPWERYERVEAPIAFVPEVTKDGATPPAHFMTVFMPDIGGMKTTVVAGLLPQPGAGSPEPGANRSFVAGRFRATEEAPMMEPGAGSPEPLTDNRPFAFAQQGAEVERTAEGFTVTVTGLPPGKPQRVEIEIPWPEVLPFTEDEFLSVQYRLKPSATPIR